MSEQTPSLVKRPRFYRATWQIQMILGGIMSANNPQSLRSAFYRAVSAGLYPNTAEKYYRRCGELVLKMRRTGVVPYEWISDSTRTRLKASSWSGLEDYAASVRGWYRRDFWGGQRDYLEVCCEKDAMSGTLSPVTEEYDVHLNVVRGNSSESFIWRWAQDLAKIKKPIHVYYLGDFDPNGLDIERDLRSRLQGFMGRPVQWKRLAVTEEDFKRDDLLGFPTRPNKSAGWNRRCADYVRAHGNRCVEVDAIPPKEIRQRLKDTIEGHIDQAAWLRFKAIEDAEKATIEQVFSTNSVLARNLKH